MGFYFLDYLYPDILPIKCLQTAINTFMSLRPIFRALCPPVTGPSHFEDLVTISSPDMEVVISIAKAWKRNNHNTILC